MDNQYYKQEKKVFKRICDNHNLKEEDKVALDYFENVHQNHSFVSLHTYLIQKIINCGLGLILFFYLFGFKLSMLALMPTTIYLIVSALLMWYCRPTLAHCKIKIVDDPYEHC